MSFRPTSKSLFWFWIGERERELIVRKSSPERGLHATAVGAGRAEERFAADQGRSERPEQREEVLLECALNEVSALSSAKKWF
jgi:hypothetical protein